MKKYIVELLKETDRIDEKPSDATEDGHDGDAPSGGGDPGSKLQFVLSALETIRASKEAWDTKSTESAAEASSSVATARSSSRILPKSRTTAAA